MKRRYFHMAGAFVHGKNKVPTSALYHELLWIPKCRGPRRIFTRMSWQTRKTDAERKYTVEDTPWAVLSVQPPGHRTAVNWSRCHHCKSVVPLEQAGRHEKSPQNQLQEFREIGLQSVLFGLATWRSVVPNTSPSSAGTKLMRRKQRHCQPIRRICNLYYRRIMSLQDQMLYTFCESVVQDYFNYRNPRRREISDRDVFTTVDLSRYYIIELIKVPWIS